MYFAHRTRLFHSIQYSQSYSYLIAIRSMIECCHCICLALSTGGLSITQQCMLAGRRGAEDVHVEPTIERRGTLCFCTVYNALRSTTDISWLNHNTLPKMILIKLRLGTRGWFQSQVAYILINRCPYPQRREEHSCLQLAYHVLFSARERRPFLLHTAVLDIAVPASHGSGTSTCYDPLFTLLLRCQGMRTGP